MLASSSSQHLESENGAVGNLEASVRSRNTVARGTRARDLIEAGLSEPAGWRAGYGDFSRSGWAETPIAARSLATRSRRRTLASVLVAQRQSAVS